MLTLIFLFCYVTLLPKNLLLRYLSFRFQNLSSDTEGYFHFYYYIKVGIYLIFCYLIYNITFNDRKLKYIRNALMLKTLCFIYPLKVLLMRSIYEKEKTGRTYRSGNNRFGIIRLTILRMVQGYGIT